MRVKELKAELATLQISTQDVFEKEQLVERLYQAQTTTTTTTTKRNSPTTKKDNSPPASTTQQQQSQQRANSQKKNVIRAPLYFTSMEEDLRIAAVNMDGGGITVNGSDKPYPTIQIQVLPNGAEPFVLTLLLDTACSGFVLRPSVITQYNLPRLNTPVTMTGAGGTTGTTGLSQLNRFKFGRETFGPLPAAVQDIGALPSKLDGIIGLSFLQQFACIEMDFEKGQLLLYKQARDTEPVDESTVIAKGEMTLLPLGIYSVDVMLGSRGPVRMLVDTGASCSFLNWRGVTCLGLSKNDSSFVQRLTSQIGAMGSDNVAMQLTHRINVSSVLKLVSSQRSAARSELPGLSLNNAKRLSIDIGDIAVLDTLRSQNVGGILGIDALMRCSGVRMTFQSPRREIFMLDYSKQ
jgi:predicted aspartyl protease